jgi:hypothetical protein
LAPAHEEQRRILDQATQTRRHDKNAVTINGQATMTAQEHHPAKVGHALDHFDRRKPFVARIVGPADHTDVEPLAGKVP